MPGNAAFVSRIKNTVCWVCLGFLSAAPLAAQTNLFLVFAECAGRMSAETEHAWLFPQIEPEPLKNERQKFVSLVEASVPEESYQAALNHRIEAKFSHASLLTLASFGDDPQGAADARKQASRYVAQCRLMLLDS